MLAFACAILLTVGCYRPGELDPCTVRCDYAMLGEAAPCPGELRCAPTGVCALANGTCGDASVDTHPPCAGFALGTDLLPLCLSEMPTGNRTITSSFNTDGVGVCDLTLVKNREDDICYVL